MIMEYNRKVYGSYQTAIETLVCLRNFISSTRWNEIEDLLEQLRTIGIRLIASQPIGMTCVTSFEHNDVNKNFALIDIHMNTF